MKDDEPNWAKSLRTARFAQFNRAYHLYELADPLVAPTPLATAAKRAMRDLYRDSYKSLVTFYRQGRYTLCVPYDCESCTGIARRANGDPSVPVLGQIVALRKAIRNLRKAGVLI